MAFPLVSLLFKRWTWTGHHSIFLRKTLTTPSMAMYSNHLGLTMLKIRSMYSKIASIISSSSLGAGLGEQRRKDKIFIATTKLAAKERVA